MSRMSRSSGGMLPRPTARVPGSNRAFTTLKNHARTTGVRPPLTFLFVVNEISIAHPLVDMWGGSRPPENPGAYHMERPSEVMKYENGIVTPFPDYFYWGRNPNQNNRGAIFARHADGNVTEAEAYKTATIFSCHPHMPFAMVDVDASVEETYSRENMPSDQLWRYPVWEPLQFLHPKDHHRRGISQAVFGASPMATLHNGPLQYVAGTNASCIPRLVPWTCQYPYPPVQPSKGLGGELTILIGLMAFCPSRDSMGTRAELFIPQYWRNNKWECETPPQGYSCSTKDTPKGFIVSVALDPWNPLGSTREALQAFEFEGVVIEESVPSNLNPFF
ncbi:unnamed protein product [Clonostachys rhizophaga]|uniref:Uncharacterized protein n=1 Tax=Clonostachys rhizophaga TaxID=160324 RepID=A0A9N9VD03_9HYPO|nr:unnamed protein product [Clonostachys rhizophaga]